MDRGANQSRLFPSSLCVISTYFHILSKITSQIILLTASWLFMSVSLLKKTTYMCGKSYYGVLLCCAWRLVLFGSSQLINEIDIYGSIGLVLNYFSILGLVWFLSLIIFFILNLDFCVCWCMIILAA